MFAPLGHKNGSTVYTRAIRSVHNTFKVPNNNNNNEHFHRLAACVNTHTHTNTLNSYVCCEWKLGFMLISCKCVSACEWKYKICRVVCAEHFRPHTHNREVSVSGVANDVFARVLYTYCIHTEYIPRLYAYMNFHSAQVHKLHAHVLCCGSVYISMYIILNLYILKRRRSHANKLVQVVYIAQTYADTVHRMVNRKSKHTR